MFEVVSGDAITLLVDVGMAMLAEIELSSVVVQVVLVTVVPLTIVVD